jgi:hypothetical protein
MATHPSQMKPPAPEISVFTCCSGLLHQEQRFSARGSPSFIAEESTPEPDASNMSLPRTVAEARASANVGLSRIRAESLGRRRTSRRGLVTIRPHLFIRVGVTHRIAGWKSVPYRCFVEHDPGSRVEVSALDLHNRSNMLGRDGSLGYSDAWVSNGCARGVDSDCDCVRWCSVPQDGQAVFSKGTGETELVLKGGTRHRISFASIARNPINRLPGGLHVATAFRAVAVGRAVFRRSHYHFGAGDRVARLLVRRARSLSALIISRLRRRVG